MRFSHLPVMAGQAVEALNVREGGCYIDGTIGGGGHARMILERAGSKGRVLGVDRDPDAIRFLENDLQPAAPNLTLFQGNFSQLDLILPRLGWGLADGILLDLGLSSYQLEESGRGFSFQRDEPLDMRMDPGSNHPASEAVNRLPEKDLANLIYEFGEERGSRRVARYIVHARKEKPIESSRELAEIVRRSLSKPGRRERLDLSTRTFMALRLFINDELGHLRRILDTAPALLNPGGRLVIISFHSLEDRLVKQAFIPPRAGERGLNTEDRLVALFKKPLRPSEAETAENPRARSAKLRAGYKRIEVT